MSRLLSGCICFKSYFPTLLYIQRKFEHSTRAGEELPGTIFAIYAPAMFPQGVPCLCPVPQIRVPYKSPQFPMSKKDYKMSRCRLCAFDIYIRIATGMCLLTDTGCCNACTSISLAELSASQVWMPSGTTLSFWEQQSLDYIRDGHSRSRTWQLTVKRFLLIFWKALFNSVYVHWYWSHSGLNRAQFPLTADENDLARTTWNWVPLREGCHGVGFRAPRIGSCMVISLSLSCDMIARPQKTVSPIGTKWLRSNILLDSHQHV